MNFDYMATTAAVLYFLAIYLHYIHISTVFYLLERQDEMSIKRALIHSIFWPWTVIMFIWADIIGEDDEEE